MAVVFKKGMKRKRFCRSLNAASAAKVKSMTEGLNLDGRNIIEEINPCLGEYCSAMVEKLRVVIDSTLEAKRALLWVLVLSHALLKHDRLILLQVAQMAPVSSKKGQSMVIPSRGSKTFLSFVGLIEHRINLYGSGTRGVIDSTIEPGNRFYADLCVMASTVAYENQLVIRNRVTKHWEMHFVEFLDCWNDYLQKKSTQAFIFCDKEVDAQLVVIAFRGTEPFNADDWETDFDFSWYQLSQIGKVHLGFLEALGLANRSKKAEIVEDHYNSAFTSYVPSLDIDENDPEKPLAYYVLLKKLKELLQVHSNAKFIVTGHSLGGALAVLFPAILFIRKEETLLERMLGVYTYGQPRVGDESFAKFVNKNLSEPVPRYFRIVYCNDIVPRLPFDDHVFQYKHFGVCLYYNSCYNEKNLQEEPKRNFSLLYFIPIRITAVWELVQSLLLQYTKGREFKETKLSILCRIVGLMVPGFSAHSPVNYINAVRLGPSTLNPTTCTPAPSKADLTKYRED